jgi:hypothetical protein
MIASKPCLDSPRCCLYIAPPLERAIPLRARPLIAMPSGSTITLNQSGNTLKRAPLQFGDEYRGCDDLDATALAESPDLAAHGWFGVE